MSKRIEKVNVLIKKELSLILLKEVDFSKNALVTITRVEAAPNLSEVKIYVSTMPDNQTDKVHEILKRRVYDIQQCLNKRLKMRPIPKIEFKKEEKTKQADRVEGLLEQLKKE
ncbi:MAG: ribosome-binding factor A [Candidatus Nealsonbacteria bacterium RBG_13_37_56]|uniref:Ribosome-binding factor A n=1 Tax=Candidatus Nealsonbacteria bacterium RBG_13_37_56 TaxID=1801661 RepID=A0A1G2DWY0_9BACT|nr:MAG: ribosome-binding factor A [Candidatus Nealsonbacteria bacterium RBG_13_37_56]